jgi:hypothetical protein
MMMFIVRLLPAKVIGGEAGKLSRPTTEIVDDPVRCPVVRIADFATQIASTVTS